MRFHVEAHSDILTESCPSFMDMDRVFILPMPQAVEKMVQVTRTICALY